MDQRRQIVAVVLMLGIFLVWMNVAPRLFPRFFPKPADRPAAAGKAVAEGADEGHPDQHEADSEDKPLASSGEDAPTDQAAATGQKNDAAEQTQPDSSPTLKRFEPKSITLGDPAKGYLQQARLNSRGAVIEWLELTQNRYQRLDRSGPIRLLGDNRRTTLKSFELRCNLIDRSLIPFDETLATVDWKFDEQSSKKIDGSDAYQVAVFRYPSPDGAWEVIKRFAIHPGEDKDPETDAQGYLIDFDLTFRNLSGKSAQLAYRLQGPVGLPLENAENTRVYRELEAGLLEDTTDPNDITHRILTAATVVSEIEEFEENHEPGSRTIWRHPAKWLSVDIQYFTTLLIPLEDQLIDTDGDGRPNPYFDEVLPILVTKAEKEARSDVSLLMKSGQFLVPAKGKNGTGELKHRFQFYAGPKRSELLAQFQAEDVINFGWFGPISKGMLWLLGFFHHGLLLPYGIAIILLTVIVRGCMFPLSKKQVAGVQKMKEINPKLQALKEKYKNDKEALTRAQLELMKKHGYNPLSGCLPIFFQLPIFIGLYNALNTSIDLRLARFLWIDNLAAPDGLIPFPNGFEIPLLGWTQLNILPLVTVVLFIVQNKLFTPPPTNEEQAMQQKMMNIMMAVIGIMFYRVPAGLCVYFIASSLWGIAERKLLDRHKRALEAASASTDGEEPPGGTESKRKDRISSGSTEKSKGPGLLAKLLEAADQAKNQTGHGKVKGQESSQPGKKKRRSKNRR